MQQFKNLFKLYDKKFRARLDKDIVGNKEDNLFYKILYNDQYEDIRVEIDNCCKLIFSDKFVEDIYYSKLRLINFKNPDYISLEPLFNELKVAYVLDKLGYKLDFNIDRTQRSGEFYFNIEDKAYLIEVKTCQKRGNIELKEVFKSKIKHCCKQVNGEFFKDFSFILNKLAITDESKTIELNEYKFKKQLKEFIQSIINNISDIPVIDFYYSQGAKLKIHIEVDESSLFKFLTPFYEIENSNYLFGILHDAAEQLRYNPSGGFVVLFGNSSVMIEKAMLPLVLESIEPDFQTEEQETRLSLIKNTIKKHFSNSNELDLLDNVNLKSIIYIDNQKNVDVNLSPMVEKTKPKAMNEFFTSFQHSYKLFIEKQ